MPYEIVFTTAEDIIGVVDAVLAKTAECTKTFICEFSDIASTQIDNAIFMAEQFELIKFDPVTQTYTSNSFIARLIISSRNNLHKAILLRLVLEQYEPYITFKSRYGFCESIDLACKQVKTLFGMASTYKDIRNAIINIATYAKAMINDGANSYKLNQDDVSYIEILELAIKFKANDDYALRNQLGEEIYNFLDKDEVVKPLSDAYSKIQNFETEPKVPIVYAASAFESFLQQIANKHAVSLSGKNGIIQKSIALSTYISKKHKGMIEYIGQIRNAADHGADPDEGGKSWNVSDETAQMYPIIVTTLIKDIYKRENGVIIV